MPERMMTREEIEAALTEEESFWRPITKSRELIPLLRTALALYDRADAAQERIEELEKLESLLEDLVAGQGAVPWILTGTAWTRKMGAISMARSVLKEARASVALDKNEDEASVTQQGGYWHLPEEIDEWGQSYGRCEICGRPYTILRPGIGQPTCDCEEADNDDS